jgi:CheY-like chemotaxis protein
MAAGKPVVLCVDDDEVGLSVRRMLLEDQGYSVRTASSGPEAMELLRSEPVDLVVLDYYMPDMDGGTVAAEIKKSYPKLPILMLSAYYWLPPETLGLADAFITKGNSPAELFDKMQELLARKGA